MESNEAIATLAALAQPTRLDAFRLLVQHEPVGIAAGELARRLEVPQNTLSTHMAILSRAGLVQSERQGRSIIFRANLAQFQALTLFMIQDCCGGSADICAPIIRGLTPCCAASERTDQNAVAVQPVI